MGDKQISELLPEFLPRLWRFALRLTIDRHDAEDLVQRACVRALERQHQYRPGSSALSWLFSIVHSVWLNEVRARQIRTRASLRWTSGTDTALADVSALTPELHVLHRQIIAAVESLPDAQRAVMILISVEGLTYQEAAETLNIPIGTIMSRVARARMKIGESLGVPQTDSNQFERAAT